MINQVVRIQGLAIAPVGLGQQDRQHHHGARHGEHRQHPREGDPGQRSAAGRDRHRRRAARGEPDSGPRSSASTCRSTRSARSSRRRARRADRRRRPPTARRRGTARRRRLARFNLNTISQGISTADFYLTVPQAIVKFLASDTRTRVLAKPQLRGAEGADLELNLGDEIPVPSTVFGGLGAGGVNTIPISSFTYKNVGVNIKMKPRVTFENEIILDIEIENSTLGPSINVAGQSLPTFGSRKVKTRMRLREGESNLIAGLVREEDRKVLRGVPGPDADPDPQGHPRRHRGADHVDRHRDPADAAHRADARADAGAPQSDLHRLADEPRAERTDAGDRRRAAAGGAGTGRRRAARCRAAGVLPGNTSPTSGGVTSTPGMAPVTARPPPAPPQPNPPAFTQPSPAFTSPTPGSAPTPVPPTSGVGTPPSTPPATPPPARPADDATARRRRGRRARRARRRRRRRRRSASRRPGRSSASAAGRTPCRSPSATRRGCR